jgi:ABC-2 type transport system ATP-binding protein
MKTVAADDPILLSVEEVSVSFGPLQAVRNVSMELHRGSLLGLIGPNGAGKTTLIRAIAGLQALSRGHIKIVDVSLNGNRDVLRQIGFTPDTPPMYEQLTVRQFLEFIGLGYELPKQEVGERIDFWLEKVWLTEKSNQKIKQLSRGMRQRVGIARTLLPNPSVILLDEPAAGLDPAGRAQFRQLLCDLREQGKALIVSSHFLADMDEYCTHIGIMSAGQMVKLGTVAEFSHAAGHERCRYTVLFSKPMPAAVQMLEKVPDVTSVQAGPDQLVLEYGSSREDAAQLLAEMVRLGLPVAGFGANSASLEETYLRWQVKQVD